MFGPVSGAHLNPVVNIVDRFHGTITTRDTALYMIAMQLLGAGIAFALIRFLYPTPRGSRRGGSSIEI